MAFSGKPVFMGGYNSTPVFCTGASSAQEFVFSTGIGSAQETLFQTGIDSAVKYVCLTGCFPMSELIHTNLNERVPIGSIKVGDRINSLDTVRNKTYFTEVTGVHQYKVNEIFCFNNSMRVSSSHPLMVMESAKNDLLTPKWKVSFDVNVGDSIVGAGGRLIYIKSKRKHWYGDGIEVLNLSTDSGLPFIVGGFVVRSENSIDNIEWADTPITQLLAA